jgi:hypothetical protein
MPNKAVGEVFQLEFHSLYSETLVPGVIGGVWMQFTEISKHLRLGIGYVDN